MMKECTPYGNSPSLIRARPAIFSMLRVNSAFSAYDAYIAHPSQGKRYGLFDRIEVLGQTILKGITGGVIDLGDSMIKKSI